MKNIVTFKLVLFSLVLTSNIQASFATEEVVQQAAEAALNELSTQPSESVKSILSGLERLNVIEAQNKETLEKLQKDIEHAKNQRRELELTRKRTSAVIQVRRSLPISTQGLDLIETLEMAKSFRTGEPTPEFEFRYDTEIKNMRDVWEAGKTLFGSAGRTNNIISADLNNPNWFLETFGQISNLLLEVGNNTTDLEKARENDKRYGKSSITLLMENFTVDGNTRDLLEGLTYRLDNNVRMENKMHFTDAMYQLVSAIELYAYNNPDAVEKGSARSDVASEKISQIQNLIFRTGDNFKSRFDVTQNDLFNEVWNVLKTDPNQKKIEQAEEMLAKAKVASAKANQQIAERRAAYNAALADALIADKSRVNALSDVVSKMNVVTAAPAVETTSETEENRKATELANAREHQAKYSDIILSELRTSGRKLGVTIDASFYSDFIPDIFKNADGLTETEIRLMVSQGLARARVETLESDKRLAKANPSLVEVSERDFRNEIEKVRESILRLRKTGAPVEGTTFKNNGKRGR